MCAYIYARSDAWYDDSKLRAMPHDSSSSGDDSREGHDTDDDYASEQQAASESDSVQESDGNHSEEERVDTSLILDTEDPDAAPDEAARNSKRIYEKNRHRQKCTGDDLLVCRECLAAYHHEMAQKRANPKSMLPPVILSMRGASVTGQHNNKVMQAILMR